MQNISPKLKVTRRKDLMLLRRNSSKKHKLKWPKRYKKEEMNLNRRGKSI